MRQNSIQNRLQMISMEEYLEKRQKIRDLRIKKRPFLHILQKGARSYSRFHPV